MIAALNDRSARKEPTSLVAQGFSFFGSSASCTPTRFTVSRCPTACSPRPGCSRRKCCGARGLPANRLNPARNPSPAEMRALFDDAGIDVSGQRRRPTWARVLSDLITVGITP